MNEEMIGIIRAHGNTAIPLVAGFNWAYDLTPVANDPLSIEGTAPFYRLELYANTTRHVF